MTLALPDYTDNATIRGLLGVSEEEVPDDILDTLSAGHLLEVTLALEDINEQVPTLFESYKDINVGTRTALQSRLYNVVRLYSAYVVADKVANGAVAMFAPITIQDGKVALQTRQDDPYTQLRASIKASLASWRTRIVSTLNLIDNTITVKTPKLTLIGTAGLPVDPVTGS